MPKKQLQIDWGFVAVLLVALAARISYFSSYIASPFNQYYAGDHRYYRHWALRIAGGDWLGQEAFEQGPLYPYLLAVGYTTGLDESLILFAQVLVGVATCALVYRCGLRLFTRPVAAAAGILAAIYGPLVYYECMLMKAFLSPFFTIVILYAALRYCEALHARWLIVAGVATGLAAMLRENHFLMFLPIAVLAWRVGKTHEHTIRRRLGHIAILATSILITISPATIRNYVVSDELVLITAGGGEVLYTAYGPSGSEYYTPPKYVRTAVGVEHEDWRAEAKRRTGRELSHTASSRYWTRQALGEAITHPVRSMSLLARKGFVLVNNQEIPDSTIYPVVAEYIPQLPWLPTFGCIIGLCVIGICSKGKHLHWLPISLLAIHALGVLVTYNFGRFRIGMTPIMILLAASGAFVLLGAFGDIRRRIGKIAILLVVGIAATVISFLPVPDSVRIIDASSSAMRTQLRDRERLFAELDRLAQQLQSTASDAPIHCELGQVFRQLGLSDRAIEHYNLAVSLDPENADAHFRCGEELMHVGRKEDAVFHVRQAVRLMPQHAEAHELLGMVFFNQGDVEKATKHYREAIESGSTSNEAHNSLAMMLVVRPGQRDTVEAIRLASAACSRTDWQQPKYMLTLAMAYHEGGRPADAIKLLERAINVAREHGLVGRCVQLEALLKAYREEDAD